MDTDTREAAKMNGAEALSQLLGRVEEIERTQTRIEGKLDSIIEFANGAAEQINSIAEQGIGGLLGGGGGLGALFGGGRNRHDDDDPVE